MLHKDPSQRPTLHEIQNAPFFWTDKQKQDHVKFILRGPKVDAIEKKVCFIIFTNFYGLKFFQQGTLLLTSIFSIYGSWFQVLVTLVKCQILFPQFAMRILVKKQSKFFPMNIVKIHLIKNHWFKVNKLFEKTINFILNFKLLWNITQFLWNWRSNTQWFLILKSLLIKTRYVLQFRWGFLNSF